MGQVMRDSIVGLSWDFATAAVAGPVVRRSPDLELVGACDGTVTAPWSSTLTRREQAPWFLPKFASPGGPRKPPANKEPRGRVDLASLRPVSLIGSGLDAHLAAFDKRSRQANPSSICHDRWLQPCWRSLQFAVSGDRQSWRCQIGPTGTDGVAGFADPATVLVNNAATSMLTERSLGETQTGTSVFFKGSCHRHFMRVAQAWQGSVGEEGRMRGYLDLLKRMTIRAPQDPERHPLYLVRAWGVAAGSLILLGACLYRRIKHPDWTGGQAVAVLWPVYMVGAFSICSGWLFRDANKTLRTPAALAGKAGIVSRLDPSP